MEVFFSYKVIQDMDDPFRVVATVSLTTFLTDELPNRKRNLWDFHLV